MERKDNKYWWHRTKTAHLIYSYLIFMWHLCIRTQPSLWSSEKCTFKVLNIIVVIIIILLHTYVKVRVNLDNMGWGGGGLSLTNILRTQPYIVSVSPPVVAVPWGATIIQPSVVKTESDVMRTVTSGTLQQSTCHAEVWQRRTLTHTHTQRLALLLNGTAHTEEEGLHPITCYCNRYTATWIQPRPLNRLEI